MSKVFLFVEIEAQPGKADEFIELIKVQADVIRSEEGCNFIEVYRNATQENTIHVWEIWSNRSAWDAHMANETSKKWREIAAQYVNGEKITVMNQA